MTFEAGRVAVGLSGGVDSAVAAALLIKQGFDVSGVFMKVWDGSELPAGSGRHACYGPGEKEDIEDAGAVCAHLGIPLLVVDLSGEYLHRVLEPTKKAYSRGLTPNPCVHCNRRLKFEALPRALAESGVVVDAFATGHYARIEGPDASGRRLLCRASDKAKDQSYFLFLLTQEILARTVFPLGGFTKSEVRTLAREIGLPVSEKAESQEFVSGGYQTLFGGVRVRGPVTDLEGRVLGEHQGIHRFTVGQRGGLGIAAGRPLYVVSVDESQNAVIVGEENDLYSTVMRVGDLNWISIFPPVEPIRADVRVRYRHEAAPATITPQKDATVEVSFVKPQRAIAPGQAAVFYDGDTVMGGGLILKPSA